MNELTQLWPEDERQAVGFKLTGLFLAQDKALNKEKAQFLIDELSRMGIPSPAVLRGIDGLMLEDLKSLKLVTIVNAARENFKPKSEQHADCASCETGVVTMQRENLSRTGFACICSRGEFWKNDKPRQMAAWNGQEFQTHNGVNLRVYVPGGVYAR